MELSPKSHILSLIAKYPSLIECFHTQRGLWDWDGRGQSIQDEIINWKAHYNHSASFDFHFCPWLTGYDNGYGRLGPLSICSFAFIMAAKCSQLPGRGRKAACYFPFLLTLSTLFFKGRAQCQRGFLSTECHSSLFWGVFRGSQTSSPPVPDAKAVKLKTTARNSSGCLIIRRQLASWSAHFTS